MAVCPQCNRRVSLKALLSGVGWAGVVCPSCNASLWPKPWSSFLLILLALGLGQLAFYTLKALEVKEPWPLLALLGVLALAYFALAGLILRLAPKAGTADLLEKR
jgi:hypothetical protein